MFCGFSELDDFILGFVKYLEPLVYDALRESSDEEDHDEMEREARDHKDTEFFLVYGHYYDFVGHRQIERELAEGNECLLACHRMEHDEGSHDEGKVESACLVDSVEEIASHHEDGIEPDADIRRSRVPDMKDPGSDHSSDDEDESPFLPVQEEGFNDEDCRKDSVAYQDCKVRSLK